MRTRAALSSIFASAGILIIGWQIGAATAAQTTSATGPPSPGVAAGTAGNAPAPAASTPGADPTTAAAPSAAPAPAAASKSGTFTGASYDTQFGSVQVQISVTDGKITDVTALHLTDRDGRSVSISNRAAPVLAQEVLAAQSANVSNVGGATYTAQAYLSSVQSAIDKAGL